MTPIITICSCLILEKFSGAGWQGSGEKGDGGTNNRGIIQKVGRTNNNGGSFNYNQQIQQYQDHKAIGDKD